MEIREAVVLCAGLGTRMLPISERVPKPCIPFLNRPILHWILDGLAANGVKRVFINLHHKGQQVVECAKAHPAGLELRFSQEPEILGTAGAFWPMRGLFKGEAFFVVNGDIFCDLPLQALAARLDQAPEALAVLAVRQTPKGASYTPLESDSRGVLKEFGKGANHFTGVYVARRELLGRLLGPGPKELVSDLLRPLLPSGLVRILRYDGIWLDLGTPRSFLGASLAALEEISRSRLAAPKESRLEYRDGFPVLRHERAWISRDASLTGPAIFGEGVRVPERCQVGNSVLLPGTILEEGERLEKTIAYADLKVPAEI
jgi:mannose-1-phosphate guanylyltransferase